MTQYHAIGWAPNGDSEGIVLDSWLDVLMLVEFLQEGQYQALLVRNWDTGKIVVSWRSDARR